MSTEVELRDYIQKINERGIVVKKIKLPVRDCRLLGAMAGAPFYYEGGGTLLFLGIPVVPR